MTMDYTFANRFGGVWASAVFRRRFESGQSSVGPESDKAALRLRSAIGTASVSDRFHPLADDIRS